MVQDLANQLRDLHPRLCQGLSARVGDRVVLAHLAAHHLILAHRVAGFLEIVQDGVERARAERIAVPTELLDDGEA
jgi:hypothetical protein